MDKAEKLTNAKFFTNALQVIIPFLKGVSNNGSQMTLKKYGIRTVFKTANKFKRFMKLGKGKTKKGNMKIVVYKMKCKSCDEVDVGQIKRLFKIRILDYKKDIDKRNQLNLSVISKHRLELNHGFDWDDVAILHREPNLQKD